ncbi:GNAT family N-acetyltransferase [Cellulomonas xiejunii]|uniref:GNAT family N-acetyltransferase n=1 Tax=Cellulomonas xiejunii TaxID=2968083 RepID=UPI001D0DD4ED|nr:GNAT family N-acetyltransferase [Cellulomonas xiejunii]MCC2314799.1 GNAT family N-acetyltransferase [Cellulomonas xiejunii]
MAARLLERLPPVLRERRDVLDGRERWAAASVVAQDDAAVVLVVDSPDGDILWSLGDVEQLGRLVPDALVGHGGGLRWATVPRAVEVPAEALAAAGIRRQTTWDRFTTDAMPPPQPGEDAVVALDPVRDAAAINACLDVGHPTTRDRPGAPDDAGWWGVHGEGGNLLGVLGVTTRPSGATPSMHLHGLGVVPAARGRGLGAAITATAARRALHAGAPWVSLGMYADNVHARRVYDALGFRVDVENAGYGPPGVTHP